MGEDGGVVRGGKRRRGERRKEKGDRRQETRRKETRRRPERENGKIRRRKDANARYYSLPCLWHECLSNSDAPGVVEVRGYGVITPGEVSIKAKNANIVL